MRSFSFKLAPATLLSAALISLSLLMANGVIFAQHGRTLVPDDLFHLEEIGDVAMSPDGQAMAYVRRRPPLTAKGFQRSYFQGNDRGDIWLASMQLTSASLNITRGDLDGSGYWMPTWSPDGARIAMLCTENPDSVELCIWEKATGRLTKLRGHRVAPWLQLPIWIDSRRLAVVLLPEGPGSQLISSGGAAAAVIGREWPRAQTGREATSDTLESGVPIDPAKHPQEQLALIDLNGGAQVVESAASIRDIQISPDGRYLAFLKEVEILTPAPDRALLGNTTRYGSVGARYGSADRYQVGIADNTGHIVAPDGGGSYAQASSFRWSPDSRAFAFVGTSSEGREAFCVFRGTVLGRIQIATSPGEIDVRAVMWLDDGGLLFSGEHEFHGDGKMKRRLDWWLLPVRGNRQSLSEKLAIYPRDLQATQSARTWVGVAGGDLWRLDTHSCQWLNLSERFEPKISAIVWPIQDTGSASGSRRDDIVVSSMNGGVVDYYDVDTTSGAITRLARPADLARLVAYRAEVHAAVFTTRDQTGTSLTIVPQDKAGWRVVEINQFLKGITEGRLQKIYYRSLDGEDLLGWLLLPANYKEGNRYPLVAWISPGLMAGEMPPAFLRLNGVPEVQVNLQLLAARGYLVLLPSMPMPSRGVQASDLFLELSKGVLPAVDKAIELGVADPDRLAVMGHSVGGIATLGLITQTNRFRAAIESAGLSDFISYYGEFPFRYERFPQEFLWSEALAETGPLFLASPPWKDVSRYIRNSPLFYVERVRTPLLIVHGDMDIVSITQGEQFFTALYRQGKRARFIRYWGEGHVLDSPANLRDFWHQTYSWLDEFCDVVRDQTGELVFDRNQVKSRGGAPPLNATDFERFDELNLKRSTLNRQN